MYVNFWRKREVFATLLLEEIAKIDEIPPKYLHDFVS